MTTAPPSPGLLMKPSVASAFRDFSTKFEGYLPYMYLDIKGLVTTGMGNLIDPIGAALELPWKRPDGSLATQSEIRAAWNLVKSRTDLAPKYGTAFAGLTTLRLDKAGIEQLIARKLRENEAYLRHRFSDYEHWPADAQLGLHSMAWAMGPGFHFPDFNAAVNRLRPDFDAAARASHMNAQGNPGSLQSCAQQRQLPAFHQRGASARARRRSRHAVLAGQRAGRGAPRRARLGPPHRARPRSRRSCRHCCGCRSPECGCGRIGASPMSLTRAALGSSAVQSTAVHVEQDVIEQLAAWLDEQIKKQAQKATLVQRLGDTTHQTVADFDLATDLVDTHALAEVIYGTGLREAHTLRMSLTYVVFALGADVERWLGRFVFRIDLSSGGGWLHQAEIPAERALVSMLMSHADSSARMSLGHSQQIIDQYKSLLDQANSQSARLLAQAEARIRVLESRETEALELRDRLSSMSREREIQGEELRRRHELRMSALEKIGGVAPLLFPQLAKATGFSGAAGAAPNGAAIGAAHAQELEAFELMRRFIASLSDKQFQGLVGLLELGQTQLLSRLYDIIQVSQRGAARSTDVAAIRRPGDREPARVAWRSRAELSGYQVTPVTSEQS